MGSGRRASYTCFRKLAKSVSIRSLTSRDLDEEPERGVDHGRTQPRLEHVLGDQLLEELLGARLVAQERLQEQRNHFAVDELFVVCLEVREDLHLLERVRLVG